METDRTIFISNLPLLANEQGLRQLFSTFGEIRLIELKQLGQKEQFQFGLIEFEEEEDAKEAIFNMDGFLFKETYLKIEKARPQRTYQMLNKPVWAQEDYFEEKQKREDEERLEKQNKIDAEEENITQPEPTQENEINSNPISQFCVIQRLSSKYIYE